MTKNRYESKQVEQLVRSIAEAVGVDSEDARLLADALADADRRGVKTHGVSRLNTYVRRIQAGLIVPNAALTIVRERKGVLALDAGNGLGQVQAQKALDLLEPRARELGIASATIRNSQHFGTLSFYCNRMAERNMILFATSNGEPAMSPAGSSQAMFGTNPVGASFPTDRGGPIAIDLATSIVARGNIIAASKQGRSIPAGWALDQEGEPTTDAGKALAGSVLTMAGHKGYALALMAELFSGALSGSAMAPNVGSMYKDMDRKQDVGHFFCLLDVSAFMDVDEYFDRVGGLIDNVKSARKRPGVDEIFVPGERSRRVESGNRADGLPIDEATLKELKTLCSDLDLPFDINPTSSFR